MAPSATSRATRCRKSLVLYNLDQARHAPYLVLVEGVTDVWCVGAGAVALLGKSISERQIDLLCKRDCVNKPLFVMLDGDARSDQNEITANLAPLGRHIVIPVNLPFGADPGNIPTAELQRLLRDAAAGRGVDLPLFAGY